MSTPRRILLVDDEPEVLKFLGRLLEDHGDRSEFAGS